MIKLIITIWIGKIIILLLKLSKKGSGTALPGKFAEKYCPGILKILIAKIPNITIVTGTNGKTTTQTFLGSILANAGFKYISNSSGSNMAIGIISELIKAANIFGMINVKYAIFEVEEATLPKIIKDINPKQIIVTNLYRDQLDAYGELDRTEKFIRDAIRQSPKARVLLNIDDPRVCKLTKNLPNETFYYGLDEENRKKFNYEGSMETIDIKDIQNTKNKIQATNIKINNDLTTSFILDDKLYQLNTPGIFHIYNVLAAIYAAKLYGIKEEKILYGVNTAPPAFGRGELIEKDGLKYKFLLIKNPVGFTLTLDLLKIIKRPNIIIILNDNIADGKDISWIWDANVEILLDIKPKLIILSGTRVEDMLLRIKYAIGQLTKLEHNIYWEKSNDITIILNKNIESLHTRTLRTLLKGDNKIHAQAYVLPTYTAMLEFRKNLLGHALNE